MTNLNYLENTYLFENKAKIIKTGENEFGKYIILNETIFYPQGGGQPSDTGEIIFGENIFEVENVRINENGIVFHYGKIKNENNYNPSAFQAASFNTKGSKVELKINQETRIKNAKNHTAGHLLDIAVNNIGLDLVAKKGFHFDTGCYVEYSGIYIFEEKEEILEKLNLEISNLISQNLKVNVENNLDGKSPEGKVFRKVYFQNYEDFGCGCGGTHLNSTLELGKVEIINIKNKKGNCKISYKVF